MARARRRRPRTGSAGGALGVGGRVALDAREDDGLRLTVQLPLAQQALPAPGAAAGRSVAAPVLGAGEATACDDTASPIAGGAVERTARDDAGEPVASGVGVERTPREGAGAPIADERRAR